MRYGWISAIAISFWHKIEAPEAQHFGSYLQMELTHFFLKGILVGNKADLQEERVVQPSVAKDYAGTHDLAFVETSARDDQRVAEVCSLLITTVFKLLILCILLFFKYYACHKISAHHITLFSCWECKLFDYRCLSGSWVESSRSCAKRRRKRTMSDCWTNSRQPARERRPDLRATLWTRWTPGRPHLRFRSARFSDACLYSTGFGFEARKLWTAFAHCFILWPFTYTRTFFVPFLQHTVYSHKVTVRTTCVNALSFLKIFRYR